MRRVLLLPMIFLVACAMSMRSPVKCAQILDSRIATANLDTLDKTTIRAWFRKNFPSVEDTNAAGDTVFWWESDGRYYEIQLDPARKWFRYELNPRPTLREVIGCFGAPSWYEATKIPAPEGSQVRLTVWYPQKGLRFDWNEHGTRVNSELTENTQFTMLIVTKPGTLDQQIESIVGGFKTETLKMLKPWPTSTPFKVTVE